MKLYDGSIAPNPRRVRMYLAENDITVDTVPAGAPDRIDLFDWFERVGARPSASA